MLVFQIDPAGKFAFVFSMRLAGRYRETERQRCDRAGSTAHQFTWHKPDVITALDVFAFGGKADIMRYLSR